MSTATPRPDVVHIIAALGPGGAERQLQSVVGNSTRDTRIIALYDGGIVADALTADGHRPIVLGGGVTRLPELVRRLRTLRPRVVHVHLLAAQLWGVLAARLAGTRVIISSEHSLMDDSIENRPLTARLRLVYRALERLTTHTVAVSPATRARLLRWGVPDRRITVVENGVDFAAFAYSAVERDRIRAEFGIPSDAAVIGAVGRLEPVKRFHELIDGLADGMRSGRWRLLIVGSGPLERALREHADARGVAEQVVLTGPRTDMAALYAAMDTLVSTSRDETFGLAVIEALGSGLPVVYAQCPALEEFDETPEICHPLGLQADADGVQSATVIDDAVRSALLATRLRSAGPPPPVSDRYGIDRTVADLESVYARFDHRRDTGAR